MEHECICHEYTRQEYKEHIFPDKKEYFRFLDMFLACKQIVGAFGYSHPATLEFCNIYKKDIMNSITVCSGAREKFGCLLPMEKMKDNPEFQKKFQAYTDLLAKIMKGCIVDYNPAEMVLNESEICFVLYSYPELAKHVKEQTYSMREILVKKGKAARYIKNPDINCVRSMTMSQIQSIPFNQRDIDFEIMAVAYNKLPITKIHFRQLPDFIAQSADSHIMKHADLRGKLLQEIEMLGAPVFGDSVMEKMRLAFIEQDDVRYDLIDCWSWDLKPVLAYMKSPSKKVKETSVRKNPYTVGFVKYQYDAIQDLALRVCHEKHTEYLKLRSKYDWYKDSRDNPWNLQVLYQNMIKNPSINIQKLYNELTL